MKTSVAQLVAGLLMTVSAAAAAQVGYPPTGSPYHDLERSQALTLLVGQYHAHRDPAFVGPQSGLLLGAHYEWRAGGPAYLTAEVSRIASNRRLINPGKTGDARELGTVSRPLWAANAGLGLGLTGAKTWHRLAPELTSGVGFISDLRRSVDSGGFRFGTRFAFNVGAGIRYVPGGNWGVRLDLTDRAYSLAYPEAYYIAPAGGTAVITSSQAKSFWTNNPAFTLGISRLF